MEIEGPYRCRPQSAGLTQEQLGELLGVTRQAVSKWESGQTTPDAATIAALCEKAPCVGRLCAVGKGAGGGTDRRL